MVDGEESLASTYSLDLLSGFVNSEVGAVVKVPRGGDRLTRRLRRRPRRPRQRLPRVPHPARRRRRPLVKDGQPVVEFDPEDHLPQKLLEEYRKKRELWGPTLRENLGYFEPLRQPKL